MKKTIAVLSAVILVGCMVLAFCGCGAEDEEIVTTTRLTSTTLPTQTTTENSGKVTDESRKDENGVIGDIVTDVSEGLSEIVTDARNMMH